MSRAHNFMDLTGQRFNKMTVLLLIKKPDHPHRTFWKCLCDCGAEKIVDGTKLKNGATQSCGCHRREACRLARTTHGHTAGGEDSREYRAWLNMKARCLYPSTDSYKHYGAVGIKVCPRWMGSFENFLADMAMEASRYRVVFIASLLNRSLAQSRPVNAASVIAITRERTIHRPSHCKKKSNRDRFMLPEQ